MTLYVYEASDGTMYLITRYASGTVRDIVSGRFERKGELMKFIVEAYESSCILPLLYEARGSMRRELEAKGMNASSISEALDWAATEVSDEHMEIARAYGLDCVELYICDMGPAGKRAFGLEV